MLKHPVHNSSVLKQTSNLALFGKSFDTPVLDSTVIIAYSLY